LLWCCSPTKEPEIYVAVVFQARLHDGALEARPVSIRKARAKS
jgi:hypothetical protein